MFTGLIKEIGTVKSVKNTGDGMDITVDSSVVVTDAQIDDSIAVNGVCLTVVAVTEKGFTVQAVKETVTLTTIKTLKTGDKINLEPALTVSDRLGGHIVQGHVDAKGRILNIQNNINGNEYRISLPENINKYIVHKGSVCIDGISLTVADVTGDSFRLAIIPHTLKRTTAQYWKTGQEVNIESDVLGRYIEKLMKSDREGLTMDKLAELGY